MYVMKYSDRDNHSYSSPEAAGKLVGSSYDSGGYPYPVESLDSARIWCDLRHAKGMQHAYPFLDIFELTVSLKEVK